VPDVASASVDAAKATLADVQLTGVPQDPVFDDTIPAGLVIGIQATTPDAPIAPGDTVNLIVSKGPAPVAIPDVKGKTRSQATSALEDLGLKVKFNPLFGALPASAVIVTGTDPAIGTEVPKGSTVNLYLQLSG
jgi:serine/threonine-protein kinase